MATIKLYENVDDLIALYRNASSDSVDSISRLVSRHILICLSNEAFAEHTGLDPVFNITYVDKLVEETGASIYDIRCMLSLLQMTKDQKTKLSNWDLLYARVVSEINRRIFDPDYTSLLKGLE